MRSSSSFRWLSLVGVIWLQAVCGTNTTFPAYSSHLKDFMKLDQIHLNYIAFAMDAGKLFGFLPGIASRYLPLWAVLFTGSVLGAIGYGVQFLFLANYISSLSYISVFLLSLLAGNGITWITTVCYVVIIRNFPRDNLIAVGIASSYQGLSAKIYTVLFPLFFNGDKSASSSTSFYLLLNTLCPLVVSLVTFPFVKVVDAESPVSAKRGLGVMFVVTISTGLFAIVGSWHSVLSLQGNAAGMMLFLLAPLLVPLLEKMKSVDSRDARVYSVAVDVELETVQEVEIGKRVENDVGATTMIKRVDFWLYFFVYLFGATLGMTYMNNLGQIAESRGVVGISSLVALSSSFGFFGRLFPSILGHILSRVPRQATIAALMVPIGASFFLLIEQRNGVVYISTIIVGACTGAITSLAVSTTTELFGTKNFSVNHNVVVTNIPIGGFVFGTLASLVYSREAIGSGKCLGTLCYRDTFVLWGFLCAVGTCLACILHIRTRLKNQ